MEQFGDKCFTPFRLSKQQRSNLNPQLVCSKVFSSHKVNGSTPVSFLTDNFIYVWLSSAPGSMEIHSCQGCKFRTMSRNHVTQIIWQQTWPEEQLEHCQVKTSCNRTAPTKRINYQFFPLAGTRDRTSSHQLYTSHLADSNVMISRVLLPYATYPLNPT